MPAPFRVSDQDNVTVDLGGYVDNGTGSFDFRDYVEFMRSISVPAPPSRTNAVRLFDNGGQLKTIGTNGQVTTLPTSGELNLSDYASPGTTANNAAGTALNNAQNALGANGGTIYVGPGNYTMDAAFLLTKSFTRIVGAGRNATRFLVNGTTIPTAFANSDTTQRRFEMHNLSILQTGTGFVGTAIDASYIVFGVFNALQIDGGSGSTVQGFNVGMSFNSVSTFYNVVRDCRIRFGGTNGYGVFIDNGANSNVFDNLNCTSSETGVTIDRTSIYNNAQTNCFLHPDCEGGGIGMWIGPLGHNCGVFNAYLEAAFVNLQISDGVMNPVISGSAQSNVNTITNLRMLGSVLGGVFDMRVNYLPFHYRTLNDGLPSPTILFPLQGGANPPPTSQVATAGRVYMTEFELERDAFVDAVGFTNGATVAGNCYVAIYGQVVTPEVSSALARTATSALVACVGANTNQWVPLTTTPRLKAGKYYAAVEFSDATHTFQRQAGTIMVDGYGAFFDRTGGFGAPPTPAQTTGNTVATLPHLRIRCVAMTDFFV